MLPCPIARYLPVSLVALAALAPDGSCQDPAAGTSRPAAEKPDLGRVVARVGDTAITLGELRAEMNRQIPLNYYHARVPAEQMMEFQSKALNALIERALIHQDAIARGLSASEEEIRDEFARTLEKSGPSFKDLPEDEKARLLEQYRPLVVRRILLDKNEARHRATLPTITEQALRQRYDQVRATLHAPAEAHLWHILVQVSPSASDAEAREQQRKVEAARARITAGETFADVAREVSQDIYATRGGDLGFVKQGTFLRGPVDKAAFALKAGELSEVVSSIYGFHLLYCEARKPPRLLSFDEVREQLLEGLKAQQEATARRRWLTELRSKFPVEILDPELQPAGARPGATSRPAAAPKKNR